MALNIFHSFINPLDFPCLWPTDKKRTSLKKTPATVTCYCELSAVNSNAYSIHINKIPTLLDSIKPWFLTIECLSAVLYFIHLVNTCTVVVATPSNNKFGFHIKELSSHISYIYKCTPAITAVYD